MWRTTNRTDQEWLESFRSQLEGPLTDGRVASRPGRVAFPKTGLVISICSKSQGGIYFFNKMIVFVLVYFRMVRILSFEVRTKSKPLPLDRNIVPEFWVLWLTSSRTVRPGTNQTRYVLAWISPHDQPIRSWRVSCQRSTTLCLSYYDSL